MLIQIAICGCSYIGPVTVVGVELNIGICELEVREILEMVAR